MKILVTDADGTIITNGNVIDQENLVALKNFKAASNNNLAILATGRNLFKAKEIVKENDFEFDYYFLANGAVILDKDFNILVSDHIQFNMNDVCQFLDDAYRIDTLSTNYRTQAYAHPKFQQTAAIISNPDDISENSYVISANFNDEEAVNAKLDQLSANFSNLQLIRNALDIDIQQAGVDKQTAISNFLELKQLTNYKLYTTGDSFNDINMLKNCENSGTFTYADQAVQKQASHVVASFADYVNNIVLN